MNAGDALHKVHISIALAAPDLKTLKEQIAVLTNQTRAWFRLRQENGKLLHKALGLFGTRSSQEIGLPDTTWRVTSRELAMMLAPLGYQKLATTDGVMRGESVDGGFPVFHNSWRDKRATHEVWV